MTGRLIISFYTSSSRSDQLLLVFNMDRVDIRIELDTGTAISIISHHKHCTVKPTSRCPVLHQSTAWLRTYSGEITDIIGSIYVTVSYSDQSKQFSLLVVPTDGPTLFGQDCLTAINVNWKQWSAKEDNIDPSNGSTDHDYRIGEKEIDHGCVDYRCRSSMCRPSMSVIDVSTIGVGHRCVNHRCRSSMSRPSVSIIHVSTIGVGHPCLDHRCRSSMSRPSVSVIHVSTIGVGHHCLDHRCRSSMSRSSVSVIHVSIIDALKINASIVDVIIVVQSSVVQDRR